MSLSNGILQNQLEKICRKNLRELVAFKQILSLVQILSTNQIVIFCRSSLGQGFNRFLALTIAQSRLFFNWESFSQVRLIASLVVFYSEIDKEEQQDKKVDLYF